MRKIKPGYLDSLLDGYLSKAFVWININRVRLILFIFTMSFWLLVSQLPYFNLIFTKELVVFLILTSLFQIFKIGWKTILYFCFGLFIISYFFDSLGLLPLSELIGNYIYGFLVIVIIKFISS
ncbi:MAG: hypothetical protein UT17_C0004G0151 [Candidatus Woesebacteria bacterium GW2011_GWB1_39_10]|uniref:Uncharacterized protein n=2 Tax=Candidatus Woeseibacteriota TaxID=1752722 RepID=A0A0G0LIT3_9BACT|nr:MAG: hypothetical protein UT17_C0004G0151 [Candidatus Woesebacteria bacterium GW2011_GWB1_39_10]KKS90793.1 MAG: hypothetical protein UV66_C0001G0150 [Candidatus Woesebacteria bacterium GW2011_GWA1_43_12]